MSLENVLLSCRHQAEACRRLGSPFTAAVCDAIAEHLPSAGHAPLRRMRAWAGDPQADALALRLCAGLHFLVLTGADETLAAAYAARETEARALWSVLEPVLFRHGETLSAWLDNAPQTNEVARSAIMLPALLAVARRYRRPLALFEIGASAGLNLIPERFHYRYGSATWGDPGAPVRLAPELRGAVPDLRGDLVIAERAGCDRAPVDLEDAAAPLRLQAYVWADQQERLERCRAAIDLARTAAVRVERRDAAEFVERVLNKPSRGVVTAIFHTVVWQYLAEATQSRIRAALAAAAGRTPDAPVAWLRFEAVGGVPPAQLIVTTWPGEQETELADGDFHGRWLDWHGPRAGRS
jgi:hypothetical protein